MIDLSIEGWPDRMRERGHRVDIMDMPDLPWFSCVLHVKEKGVVVNVFSGCCSDSLVGAIKRCQDKFGLSNVLRALDESDLRSRQRANMKEVKRLLSE